MPECTNCEEDDDSFEEPPEKDPLEDLGDSD